MADVSPSERYAWSLIIKTGIVFSVFWITVYLLLGFIGFAGMNVQLAAGNDNGAVILALAVSSFVLASILEFVYVNLLKRSLSLSYNDSAVTFRYGFIGKNQVVIEYKDLKEAHTVSESLNFVDNAVGVSTVVVHGNQTMSIPGIKNASEIIKEIGDRASAKKEKKADAHEILAKEVISLKSEVAALKKKLEEKEKKETSHREDKEPKKKFVLKPFEESM